MSEKKKLEAALSEASGWLDARKRELRTLELSMARRYSVLTYSEIRDLDEKAGKIQAAIKSLKTRIRNLEKKLSFLSEAERG